MQYEVIRIIDGEWSRVETPNVETWAADAGYRVTGYRKQNPQGIQLREELVGQPIIEGLAGPMYGGPGKVRYEDWKAYDHLSS
jgi:hypothetical protein